MPRPSSSPSRSRARTVARANAAAALLVAAAACAPHVPPLRSPLSVEAFCGSKQARNTGIASVLTSTDDVLLDESPTLDDIRRALAAGYASENSTARRPGTTLASFGRGTTT